MSATHPAAVDHPFEPSTTKNHRGMRGTATAAAIQQNLAVRLDPLDARDALFDLIDRNIERAVDMPGLKLADRAHIDNEIRLDAVVAEINRQCR